MLRTLNSLLPLETINQVAVMVASLDGGVDCDFWLFRRQGKKKKKKETKICFGTRCFDFCWVLTGEQIL
jgi:hypothetical protein